jgi:hypothetical protein
MNMMNCRKSWLLWFGLRYCTCMSFRFGGLEKAASRLSLRGSW